MSQTTDLLNDLDKYQASMPAKQLINVLVEYLVDDIYWLNSNISEYDRELLTMTVNRIGSKGANKVTILR